MFLDPDMLYYLHNKNIFYSVDISSFLPLGATAQGELWLPEHSASILL
jgi:hypothetical protein